MARRWVILVLALVTLLNLVPMMLFTLGGDIDFHFVLIDCFAQQFWSGDLYPRWCISGNAGLGAPIFMSYFPLAYYLTALIYPITYLGLSLCSLYLLSMILATFATGLSCYSWLKDIVTPGRALLASTLFLFMPYRMEALLFRSSFAEIWFMAVLPLFFKYLRRLAQGEGRALLCLAGTLAVMLLMHLPGSAVAGIAGGIYIVCVAWKRWDIKLRFAAAMAWGGAMAAFYLVPAVYYRQFMAPFELAETSYGWPNTFLRMYNLTVLGHGRIVLTLAIVVLALSLLALYSLIKRKRVSDNFVQREIVAFSVASAIALFLLFPVSQFFYTLIGPLSQITFPWRMQAIFAVALVFFIAVWMQYFASEKKLKTWKGDFSMLLLLMALMSYFVVGVREEDASGQQEVAVRTHYAGHPEYRSIWTDKEHFAAKRILLREKKPAPFAQIIKGKGSVTNDGMTLDVKATNDITLRIDHFYFPVWAAEGFKLYPEEKTGQMLLDVPAGEHHITLSYATWRGNPLLIGLAYLFSTLATVGWFFRFRQTNVFL